MSLLDWVKVIGWTLAGMGGAAVLVWLVGRSGRHLRRCPRCDYDMSGTPGLLCPECGRTARGERALRRRRRRRAFKYVGAMCGVIGLSMAGTVLVKRDGWAALAPDWAVWPVMGWFDGSLDTMIANLEAGRLSAASAGSGSGSGSGAGGVAAAAIQSGRSARSGPKPLRWERLLRARRCVVNLEGKEIAADGVIARDARQLGAESRLVVDRVLAMADGLSSEKWMNATECLKWAQPLDEGSIRCIRSRLARTDDQAWLVGFDMVWRTAKARAALRKDLAAALDRETPEVRAQAALYLYDLTPLGEPELSKLEALRAGDASPVVRGRAGTTLEHNAVAKR